jgi:hypothetical protein
LLIFLLALLLKAYIFGSIYLFIHFCHRGVSKRDPAVDLVAYTQQGRAHIRRLHPDWGARPALMSRAAHAAESKAVVRIEVAVSPRPCLGCAVELAFFLKNSGGGIEPERQKPPLRLLAPPQPRAGAVRAELVLPGDGRTDTLAIY